MRILGVDPALVTTGYGVIDCVKREFRLVEAGIITTTTKQPIEVRLEKIHRAISDLIRETKPQVLVLEKIFSHYRHPTTSYLLGQARGVICLTCAQAKIPLVEYPATRVKKAVVGKGLAGKYQVQKVVGHLLQIEELPKYSDVTDALALAIAHSYIGRSAVSA